MRQNPERAEKPLQSLSCADAKKGRVCSAVINTIVNVYPAQMQKKDLPPVLMQLAVRLKTLEAVLAQRLVEDDRGGV